MSVRPVLPPRPIATQQPQATSATHDIKAQCMRPPIAINGAGLHHKGGWRLCVLRRGRRGSSCRGGVNVRSRFRSQAKPRLAHGLLQGSNVGNRGGCLITTPQHHAGEPVGVVIGKSFNDDLLELARVGRAQRDWGR